MNVRISLIIGCLIVCLGLPFSMLSQNPSSPAFVSTLNLNSDSARMSLRVFPNPVTQSARFRVPVNESEACHLYLVDVQGKVVRTFSNLNGPEVEISLKEIPTGLYLVELRGVKSYYTRILVE